MGIELRSSAFEPGQAIPARHTCDGENVSPALRWRGVPADAKSLVLIFDAPDAMGKPWSHWILYDIPAYVDHLAEHVPAGDRLPGGAAQGRNDFSNAQYEGSCPPPGETYDYYFRLYAIDQDLDLPAGAAREQVLNRIQGHIIEMTELMGRYARSQGS